MVETRQSNFEMNFYKNWLLICIIGSITSGVFGVLGGGGAGYYLGDKLGLLLGIPVEALQLFSDFLASVLVGFVAGGIESFFQWILLRKYLSKANLWILAGILGGSIGGAINSLPTSTGIVPSTDDARFISLFCVSLVITTPIVGLLQGFLEWFVLQKDFQNSTKWINIRIIINIVVVIISLIEFIVRTILNSTILVTIFTLVVSGTIEGIIFGAITGHLLKDFLQKKG